MLNCHTKLAALTLACSRAPQHSVVYKVAVELARGIRKAWTLADRQQYIYQDWHIQCAQLAERTTTIPNLTWSIAIVSDKNFDDWLCELQRA